MYSVRLLGGGIGGVSASSLVVPIPISALADLGCAIREPPSSAFERPPALSHEMGWLLAASAAVPSHERAFQCLGSIAPFFPFLFQLVSAENSSEIGIIRAGYQVKKATMRIFSLARFHAVAHWKPCELSPLRLGQVARGNASGAREKIRPSDRSTASILLPGQSLIELPPQSASISGP